jgi:hypothetical protein
MLTVSVKLTPEKTVQAMPTEKKKNIWKHPEGNPSRKKRYIEDDVRPKFLRGSVSLAKAFPEIAAEWFYAKNCG